MNILNHKNLSDEDLVVQISLGNHLCFLELYSRYEKHAYKLCNEYMFVFVKDGLMLNDLISVALSSLVKSLKKYQPSKGLFFTFWKKIATHDLQDFATKYSYNIGGKMFNGLSLSDSVISTRRDDLYIELGTIDTYNEDRFLTEEFYQYVSQKVLGKDKKALKILKLLIYGYSVNEISIKTKISIKSIYYHISSLKKLYKLFISKLY